MYHMEERELHAREQFVQIRRALRSSVKFIKNATKETEKPIFSSITMGLVQILIPILASLCFDRNCTEGKCAFLKKSIILKKCATFRVVESKSGIRNQERDFCCHYFTSEVLSKCWATLVSFCYTFVEWTTQRLRRSESNLHWHRSGF